MVPGREVLELTAHQRFFPIFSFLFGVSFALFLRGPAQRHRHPRVVLIRRLIALGLPGLAHQMLQPGEALLPYAVFGSLVLLPASWLPRWLTLGLGATELAAASALGVSGPAYVPSLFLLGLATADYGIPQTLERRHRGIRAVFVIAGATGAGLATWQATLINTPQPSGHPGTLETSAGLAGLAMAACYLTGLLLLLRTRLGRPVTTVLASLGRMALTHYVTATLIVTVAAGPLGLRAAGPERMPEYLGLCLGIILVQILFSLGWLHWFSYGPLEWLWRVVTWWQPTPLRRSRSRPGPTGTS